MNFCNITIEESSFRDPSGFVFKRDGILYRQVNELYKNNYNLLMDSGLYKTLVDKEMLVPHIEENIQFAFSDQVYKVIQPEVISFISYPYEWSFSQLKDAALLTLNIQKIALEYNMSLKDASVYNIQFRNGKPLFIDTLSFERYTKDKPWIAYKQFCQHFLAPLALMSYRDIRLSQLLKNFIDGIPLDLTSSLLPFKTKLNLSLLSHIHLHAKSQKHYSEKRVNAKSVKLSKTGLLAIIDSIETVINKLTWQPFGTEWADYYERNNNYTSVSHENKKKYVADYLKKINPATVWDLGANTGIFSRIACEMGAETISFDIDPSAVEKNYLQTKKSNDKKILPLLLDLTNPSPGIGWQNQERGSLIERGPADAVLALALIHHLAISNNVPLNKIANFFASICNYLIIEFVPKRDSQVEKLLATREDVFDNYDQQSFEETFKAYFKIIEAEPIKESERILYLMKRRTVNE